MRPVSQGQAELGVDLGLVCGVGCREHADDVLQCCDHGGYLLSAHPLPSWALPQPTFGESALGLDFGHPPGDHRGVGAGFERGAVRP
ncbi:MAG: hypothetical protein ACR2FU_21655 [Streptosporangiaceae bacterium]